MKTTTVFSFLLGSLLLSRSALAQDCSGISYVPVPGSAGAAVANQAYKGFGKLYGATAATEREVLPLLRNRIGDNDDSAAVVHLRSNSIYGAGRQLLVAEQGNAQCPNFVKSDYDLYSASLGFAMRYKWFSLYYVTSVVGGQPDSSAGGRVLNPIAAVAVVGVYTAIAPGVGSWDVNEKGVSISGDYIAGAQAEFYGTNFAVGYIGSTGLYTNISQEKLRLFASTAITREFKELAYLTAGLDRLKTIKETLTSLYARKLVFSPPATFRAGSFIEPTTKGIDFWTGHLEQLNIAKLFDAKFAVGVTPNVLLHDARIGVHTAEYHRDPTKKVVGHDGGAAGFEIGTVRIPENTSLAQTGGHLLSIKGVLKMYPQNGLAGDLGLTLAFNDPDVLSKFPAARNVFSFNFGGSFRAL